MKRRPLTPAPARTAELAQALAALDDPGDVLAYLIDLCTPAEIEAMADRWAVVGLLAQQVPYREIAEQLGVSSTTVTRVARSLSAGAGGYRTALAARGSVDA